MEEKFVPLVTQVTDIIQIGSRNMQITVPYCMCQNEQPIMLRHYGSSLRDWLGAAEYIHMGYKVILCERG